MTCSLLGGWGAGVVAYLQNMRIARAGWDMRSTYSCNMFCGYGDRLVDKEQQEIQVDNDHANDE